MIRIKENPVGIDFEIQRIQGYIYNYLTNVGVTNYESYGRAYKNPRNENIIPEIYNGNNEYEEVLFNDKKNLTSFFLIDDTTSFEEVATQTVSFICQGKFNEVLPFVNHRADEEFVNIITNLLDRCPYKLTLRSIERGIDNVFREFNTEAIKFDDMQDFFVVRFNFEINFNYHCTSTINTSDTTYINFAGMLQEFLLPFSKEKKATDCFLKRDSAYSNEVQLEFPFSCLLTAMYAYGSENQTWKAEVYIDGVLLDNAVVNVTNDTTGIADNLNLVIEKNSKINVFLTGDLIEKPKVLVHLKRL